ncbi:reverse transcriptase domain-containing protein [Tanacetum coccineum]
MELAHIISPSEYDHFCFKIEPELGNLTMDVVEDIFPTREPRAHVPNVLTTHPTLHLDTDLILFSEPLFAYIVWIFLPFSLSSCSHILSPVGMKTPFLDPHLLIFISLCRNVLQSGNFIKLMNGYLRKGRKTKPKRQNRTRNGKAWKRQSQDKAQAPPPVVEKFNLEEPVENPAPPLAPMDDNRTMAQLLEAPTAGYEDAIVVPEITADNFELKHGLLNLVQNKQFFGHDKEDPHAHIRYFNKITSTMKFPNVPSTSVKLMLFPFSLEGAARIWLKKEPPRSIQTWDDLVSKFINKFFPPSKTTNLRNKITNFKQQRFD